MRGGCIKTKTKQKKVNELHLFHSTILLLDGFFIYRKILPETETFFSENSNKSDVIYIHAEMTSFRNFERGKNEKEQ